MNAPKPVALFFPFDLLSHYLRCLQLAEAIRGDYDCVFLHSDSYGGFVEGQGFRQAAGRKLCAAEVVRQSKDFRFDWLENTALEAVFRSQCALIRRFRPALVVGDTSHTLKMAASHTGTPFVAVLNGYLSRYYAVRRPMPSAHPLVRHTGLPPSCFAPFVPLGERIVFRQIHRPFRQLREKYRLPRLESFEQELEGDLTCIADSPLLFPLKPLPPSHAVIGPLYHSGERREPALEHFLDTAKPTVIVAMGSTGALERVSWLNERRFAAFNVVVAGGTPDQFPASHIHAAPFLNLTAVLPSAALVICHGGNGTLNQALAQGVPVLCLPEFFEQEWNAHRIQELGYGRIIPSGLDMAGRQKLMEDWMAQKDHPRYARLAPHLQVEDSLRRFREAVKVKSEK
jgi:UDP:flavonoid glycosyltransferase YjiC (YdhE family)